MSGADADRASALGRVARELTGAEPDWSDDQLDRDRGESITNFLSAGWGQLVAVPCQRGSSQNPPQDGPVPGVDCRASPWSYNRLAVLRNAAPTRRRAPAALAG